MSSSAAGGAKDSGFDLTDQAFISDEFRMYHFKVRLLPITMHCHSYVDHRVHLRNRRAPLATPGRRLASGSVQRQAMPAYKSCHPYPQIKRCPQARPHDWTRCPFAHPGARTPAAAQRHASCAGLGHCPVGRAQPKQSAVVPCAGEKAKRRDPRKYQYSGTACPEFRKVSWVPGASEVPFCPIKAACSGAHVHVAHFTVVLQSGCCRRGDACPFAHGVFECWCHPSRYRTQVSVVPPGVEHRPTTVSMKASC